MSREFYHITRYGDYLIQYKQSEHVMRLFELIEFCEVGKEKFQEMLIISQITSPIKISLKNTLKADVDGVFECYDADMRPFTIEFSGKTVTVTIKRKSRVFFLKDDQLCYTEE